MKSDRCRMTGLHGLDPDSEGGSEEAGAGEGWGGLQVIAPSPFPISQERQEE